MGRQNPLLNHLTANQIHLPQHLQDHRLLSMVP